MLLDKTPEFNEWFLRIKDIKGKAAIVRRLLNLELGNFGDHKSLGAGLFESRIHSGPGYRLYYTIQGELLLILLCGGHKDSQKRDIKIARQLLKRETSK